MPSTWPRSPRSPASTAPAAPATSGKSPKAKRLPKPAAPSSARSATPSTPACSPTPAARPEPGRRAREGTRGTTLHPARPARTPHASSSDQPLPSPVTTLRPPRPPGPGRRPGHPCGGGHGKKALNAPAIPGGDRIAPRQNRRWRVTISGHESMRRMRPAAAPRPARRRPHAGLLHARVQAARLPPPRRAGLRHHRRPARPPHQAGSGGPGRQRRARPANMTRPPERTEPPVRREAAAPARTRRRALRTAETTAPPKQLTNKRDSL